MFIPLFIWLFLHGFYAIDKRFNTNIEFKLKEKLKNSIKPQTDIQLKNE